MIIRARLYFDGRYYRVKIKRPCLFGRWKWFINPKHPDFIMESTSKVFVMEDAREFYGESLQWEDPPQPNEWVSTSHKL